MNAKSKQFARAEAPPLPVPKTPNRDQDNSLTVTAPVGIIGLQRKVGNAATRRLLIQRTPQPSPAPTPASTSDPNSGASDLNDQKPKPAADDAADRLRRMVQTMNPDDREKVLNALNGSPVDGYFRVPIPEAEPGTHFVDAIIPEIDIPLGDAAKLKQDVLDVHVQDLMGTFADFRSLYVAAVDSTTEDAMRRRAVEALHEVDEQFLSRMRPWAKQRKNAWQHPRQEVQDAVLAALQLGAVFTAESYMGKDADAKKKSQDSYGMYSDWCGMFAAIDYDSQSLDSDLRNGFLHVDNVVEYFTYAHQVNAKRVPKWIWAADPDDGTEKWMENKVYHEKRKSARIWTNAQGIMDEASLDIRPGDMVLIDHTTPGTADHIVLVQSYDPNTKTLITIGGNDGGYTVDNNPNHKSPAEGSDDARMEAALGKNLKAGAGAGVGVSLYNLNNQSTPIGKGDLNNAGNLKRARVFGIGRPSVVDFEQHFYDANLIKPTKAPKGANIPAPPK